MSKKAESPRAAPGDPSTHLVDCTPWVRQQNRGQLDGRSKQRRPAGERSKDDCEGSVTVRMRSAMKRESGALIRAGVISGAGGKGNGQRHGEVRTARNNSAGIACRTAGGTSTSGSQRRVTVRMRSATECESGALIRASVVNRAGDKKKGHRHGEVRTVRNNSAGIACRSAGGASTSGSQRNVTVRMRSATRCESGALIRAGVVSNAGEITVQIGSGPAGRGGVIADAHGISPCRLGALGASIGDVSRRPLAAGPGGAQALDRAGEFGHPAFILRRRIRLSSDCHANVIGQ